MTEVDEEDMKSVMEATDTKKKAKPKKSESDKDSTDIHISILEKEMQNMQKIPRNAYGKDSRVLFFHKEGSNQY